MKKWYNEVNSIVKDDQIVRTFFGYLAIFTLVPTFIALIFFISEEGKNVKGLHEVLDEKIKVDSIELAETSFIVDKNKQVVSELYDEENRVYLPLTEIPTFLIDLFIMTEDKLFYEHIGFDLQAMGRALAINMQTSELEQGASTITQQLARNYFLTHEKTYNRKLSEILYAYTLERNYSKDEILELYLNAIYFQHGAYGIEAAAQYYFQQPTNKLSKAQLAFLAAIPNNPTLYDPVKNFANTKKRQERLVKQMVEAGSIAAEEAEQMMKEKITLAIKKRTDVFPDYTTYVEAELTELVAQAEGYDKLLAQASPKEQETIEQQLMDQVESLLNSGVTIHTALDPTIQKKAVHAVQKFLPYDGIEGAATVIHHHKREIVALVGGKQYRKHDFNRAYQAFRQPGSTIKPLIAYAPYFERTNASIYDSINADSFCIGNYCPKNYGGGQYGNVTLETAFIHSFNTPAVRLLQRVGIDNAFVDLQKFQFSHISKKDYHFPAAIGGFTYGMSPLELTDAFTVFANNGYYEKARAIQKVTDRDGHELYKWKDENIKVWRDETVTKIRHLMKKTVQSGTARKAAINKPYVGGKTGTSNDYRDLWFVGLTDELTTGVWVGKDKPASLENINSISPQLLIWREIVN